MLCDREKVSEIDDTCAVRAGSIHRTVERYLPPATQKAIRQSPSALSLSPTKNPCIISSRTGHPAKLLRVCKQRSQMDALISLCRCLFSFHRPTAGLLRTTALAISVRKKAGEYLLECCPVFRCVKSDCQLAGFATHAATNPPQKHHAKTALFLKPHQKHGETRALRDPATTVFFWKN
jgi:hypothetical protein